MCDCLHMGPFPALLNFPYFPTFIISVPSSPPLNPLWLQSSSYLDLLTPKHVHHCAVNGLGSHRNPLFSFLPIQKYLLDVFTFSCGAPKRGFCLQFYKEVTKSGPCAKFTVHVGCFCLAQPSLDISVLANRTGRDLLWYNLVVVWYNPFHKLFKLKSDWIVCFSGKGSENLIPLEETSFQFPA